MRMLACCECEEQFFVSPDFSAWFLRSTFRISCIATNTAGRRASDEQPAVHEQLPPP